MNLNKKRIFLFSSLTLILVLIVIFFLIVFTLPQLPEQLHDLALSTPTEIYSDTGELIIVLSNRDEVKLDQISQHFIDAILAMEDTDFYKHHGLNKKGLLRAVFNHLITMKRSGGGSSITQQLAKNLSLIFQNSLR